MKTISVTEETLAKQRRKHIAITAVCFAVVLLVLRFFTTNTIYDDRTSNQLSNERRPIEDNNITGTLVIEPLHFDVVTEPPQVILAEQALASLLNDQDPEIRAAAVEALGAQASPDAIGGLSYALRDPDELVRRSAIEYLAEIGTRDALEALTITLDDQDTDLRLSVVTELADIESAPAAALLQRFLSDSDPLVREIAAESLNESLE